MALIVVSDPKLYKESKEKKQEALIPYAESFTGTTRFLEPSSFQEWEYALKNYRPRQITKSGIHRKSEHNLIILGGVDKFYPDPDTDVGYKRLADLFISNRGGISVGKQPDYDSLTYFKSKDPYKASKHANYTHTWAYNHNMAARASFLGRGDAHPRAILFGYSLDFPKISMGGLVILGGLTDYDNFWKDCAWMRVRSGRWARENVKKTATELYPDAARIAITENAHNILTEMGIEHEYLVGRPGVAKTAAQRKQYSNDIYELFTTYNENFLKRHEKDI